MEAQRVVGRRRVVRLVVDVVPERRQRAAERPVAALLDRDPRARGEGHREERVHAVRRPEAGVHRGERCPELADARVRHPKKSPSGTSTDGVASPSHQQRRIASR
jgi:hypothetical protein